MNEFILGFFGVFEAKKFVRRTHLGNLQYYKAINQWEKKNNFIYSNF